METTITRSVQEIADDERALEGLLGSPLAADQHVLILAHTPDAPPDTDARTNAHARLEKLLASSQQFAESHGISSEEADAAVHEAMKQTRPRSSCE